MEPDHHLRDIAERQHGLVAVRQAYALGFTHDQLAHRLERGGWVRRSSRVIGLSGAPPTDLVGAMLAVLHHGPDSFVSHGSALAVWGIPGFDLEPVHVIARRLRNRSTNLAIVHSSTNLLESHVAEIRGLPIVTPIRAIFDIAGRTHPGRVERALDNAWNRRLLDYALLHRTLTELSERGRPGIQLLRELAAARPRDYRPAGSNLEDRVREILERAGERPLRRQIDRGSPAAWVGRVDFVDDDLPVVVEVQSELFHGSVLDRRLDGERVAALVEAGHEVVEVWETDVFRRPDWVVDEVRSARRRAATGRAA